MSLTPEETVAAFLKAQVPVVQSRVTPNRPLPLPPATTLIYPLLVYRVITGMEVWTMKGGTGLFEGSFEVQSWGSTNEQARGAIDDAYRAFAAFAKVCPSYLTPSGVWVGFIRPKQPKSAYHDELKVPVKIMDVDWKFEFFV